MTTLIRNINCNPTLSITYRLQENVKNRVLLIFKGALGAGSVAATDPNSVLKHFPLNFNMLVFDNDDFFWLPKSSRTQKAIHEFMTEQNAFLEP